MRQVLSNNRAGVHKDVGLLASLCFFIAGCALLILLNGCVPDSTAQEVPEGCHPCPGPNGEEGWCCENPVPEWEECLMEEPGEPEEPACIPEWCSCPLQPCDQLPACLGHDSCGNPCTKPSPDWPNCREV